MYKPNPLKQVLRVNLQAIDNLMKHTRNPITLIRLLKEKSEYIETLSRFT